MWKPSSDNTEYKHKKEKYKTSVLHPTEMTLIFKLRKRDKSNIWNNFRRTPVFLYILQTMPYIFFIVLEFQLSFWDKLSTAWNLYAWMEMSGWQNVVHQFRNLTAWFMKAHRSVKQQTMQATVKARITCRQRIEPKNRTAMI